MAVDRTSFRFYNIMIVTLVIIVIDWAVLVLNDIPWLPLHCFYLAYLTITLRMTKQPKNYTFSVQKAEELLKIQTPSSTTKIAQCLICHKAKPPRYYHCRRCSKCIYRLDHHCDFVGNCIGQYNYKVYVHLLVNAFAHAFIVVLIIGWNWRGMVGLSGWTGFYWLLILPGIFGMFETTRLMLAFKATVQRNQTLVQSYKMVRGAPRSYPHNMEEYFGKEYLSWFLPTFISSHVCDLLEATYPLDHFNNVKEYTYADEYIYGQDDEDEFEEEKQD